MDILERLFLAKNPDTLTFLSKDGFWGVRCHVAVNPTTPYGVWVPNSGAWVPVSVRVLP